MFLIQIYKDEIIQHVPQAEAIVLSTLIQMNKVINAVEIAQATKKINIRAVYVLLMRLEKRGLVTRIESWVKNKSGVPVRRALYSPISGLRSEKKRCN